MLYHNGDNNNRNSNNNNDKNSNNNNNNSNNNNSNNNNKNSNNNYITSNKNSNKTARTTTTTTTTRITRTTKTTKTKTTLWHIFKGGERNCATYHFRESTLLYIFAKIRDWERYGRQRILWREKRREEEKGKSTAWNQLRDRNYGVESRLGDLYLFFFFFFSFSLLFFSFFFFFFLVDAVKKSVAMEICEMTDLRAEAVILTRRNELVVSVITAWRRDGYSVLVIG